MSNHWERVAARMSVMADKVKEKITFTMKVVDPDQMVAWIRENCPEDTVGSIICYERDGHYKADITMYDGRYATLVKTFWAK